MAIGKERQNLRRMAYYTEAHFRNYRANLNESQRTFSARARTDLNMVFDIFISYNINDKAIITGVYNELTERGFKVYVDFIVDSQLDRSNVDLNTAQTIRRRLENSKSLIYAQSPNAAMSKWMPWELGVVDGHTKRCAVLPILTNGTDFYYKQEYLKLYPVIKPSVDNTMYVYKDVQGRETLSTVYSFVNL